MKKESGKRRPWLSLLPALGLVALALGLWLAPRGSTQPAEAHGSRTEKPASAPYLEKEESFFSDFKIQATPFLGPEEEGEEQVRFLCYLCIVNPTDETLPVTVTGDFSADYDAGLVTERELTARYLGQEAQPPDSWTTPGFVPMTEEAAELFLLAPGGNHFWAVFSGPHGKTDVKQDRLLPSIRIETVEGLRCVVKLNGKTVTIGRESAELLWLCRNALTKSFPDALVDRDSRQGPGISLNFQAGEALNTNSPSHSYFGDYIIFYDDVCNYSAAPMLDLAMNVQLSAGTYDRVLAALEKAGVPVGEPTAEQEAGSLPSLRMAVRRHDTTQKRSLGISKGALSLYDWYELIQHVRQESDLAGALDRLGQLALMHGAGTGGAARQDLAALGQVAAQLGGVLIINISRLVHAELANFCDGQREPDAERVRGSRCLQNQNGSSPSSSLSSSKPERAGAEAPRLLS